MIRDTSAMDKPVEKPARFSKKVVVVGLAGAVLLLAAILLYPSWRRWSQSETSVDLSRIRIAEVTRGDLVRDVSADGRIVAAFHPTLFSPAPGIVRLFVAAGEVVTSGQELAHVESPELESRLGQERSSLLSLEADYERQRILSRQTRLQNQQAVRLAEVELEAARRAMRRAEQSRAEGLLNDVDYEKAQDDVRVSELRLELARQRADFEGNTLDFEEQNRKSLAERQGLVVRELERQVESLAIRSPVSGLVSRLEVEDHDAVEDNAALIAVVDLSAFEVEIAVAETYADEIVPGTEAVVTYDGTEYRGEVKSISPEVQGSRVEGIVAFTDDPPAGLKQNQRVATRLVLETRPDVVKVARGPFLEAGGGRQAYLVEEGLAVLRPIEVGSLSVTEIEIASGLEPGHRIIVSDTTRFKGAERILLRR